MELNKRLINVDWGGRSGCFSPNTFFSHGPCVPAFKKLTGCGWWWEQFVKKTRSPSNMSTQSNPGPHLHALLEWVRCCLAFDLSLDCMPTCQGLFDCVRNEHDNENVSRNKRPNSQNLLALYFLIITVSFYTRLSLTARQEVKVCHFS